MKLTERERELGELTARADKARAGTGSVVIVSGESGAGKTSFVETFLERWPAGERVLWGACDPLATPRPLGPIHDLAAQFAPATRRLLHESDLPYQIFNAVFDELARQPSVLVIDDVHWADQGTVDLLRFVLRRIRRTRSLVIAAVRDDELGATHSVRSLLGDIARTADAAAVCLPPLTFGGVVDLIGDRDVDPRWLHRTTGGNAFFVNAMLDHTGDDLPTTVRDAILARTVGLDVAAWDLLHLLACAPEAIPDYLLVDLHITATALRSLAEANLIRRGTRGVAFRHDLCRRAVASVIPPGAEADLHRRMIAAYEAAAQADPAIITHHAQHAGDPLRLRSAASDAGRAATRSGAHRQATEFYEIALNRTGPLPPATEAELLELLAAEYYVTDRLDDAIVACRRAMRLRAELRDTADVSANHHALSVYEWYNANRGIAEHHVGQAIAVLDDASESDAPATLPRLGHALAMQAFLAVQLSDLDRAAVLASQAQDIAAKAGDPTLVVRAGLIAGFRAVLAGESAGREAILSIIRAAPEDFDEIYSSGYSNLTYLDIEQRRFEAAAELLEVSIPLTIERDLPICRAWQVGSRGRLEFLTGDWHGAVADADLVLDGPSAPLARTWPLLVRSLVSVRRKGAGAEGLDEAWRLAARYGEPLRLLPAAAAIAEWAWLSGSPDSRLDECHTLLADTPTQGLEWSRGELAMWLRRLDPGSGDCGDVATPYRLLLDRSFGAAADEFHRLSMPYEAALAWADSGDIDLTRRGLDTLDRLGAIAVAAKIRRDLRSRGLTVVPARRRSTTQSNPAGLTSRQVEVLRLLSEGLTNAELAERLYLSVKTVDHHVSAILGKLQTDNRRDAVRQARAIGALD